MLCEICNENMEKLVQYFSIEADNHRTITRLVRDRISRNYSKFIRELPYDTVMFARIGAKPK